MPDHPPERIDLGRADDPRDVVHRAVACLAQGGLVGLPTGTGYALAACCASAPAVALLCAAAAGSDRPTALLVRGAGEVADWAPSVGRVGRRLALRGWPGPLTLVFAADPARPGLAARLSEPARALVAPDGTIALTLCPHPIVREVARLLPAPLSLAGPPAAGADDLADIPGLAMLVDDGPSPRPGDSTVVRVGPVGYEVVRPGLIDAGSLARMAGTIVLFVCTGNTCRSPMAEALCKARLADRLKIAPDALEAAGYVIISAGVAATAGMPAADHAVAIVRELGGSLDDHASRPAGIELVRMADVIIAMTTDHLDLLLERAPDAEPRARLLDPNGGDLDDPVGSDLPNYRRTAEAIIAHLDPLLDELLRRPD